MSKALFLSPMVPSRNLDTTAQFFQDLLGFKLVYSSPTYRICEKDGLTVHLLPAGENVGQMEFYLEVDDVNAIWESIQDKISHLKHRAPIDQEYKMREVHIEIPETNALLFIGQALP